jgi:hypothetical protein
MLSITWPYVQLIAWPYVTIRLLGLMCHIRLLGHYVPLITCPYGLLDYLVLCAVGLLHLMCRWITTPYVPVDYYTLCAVGITRPYVPLDYSAWSYTLLNYLALCTAELLSLISGWIT